MKFVLDSQFLQAARLGKRINGYVWNAEIFLDYCKKNNCKFHVPKWALIFSNTNEINIFP